MESSWEIEKNRIFYLNTQKIERALGKYKHKSNVKFALRNLFEGIKDRKYQGRTEAFGALLETNCRSILTFPGITWGGENMFLKGNFGKVNPYDIILHSIEEDRVIFNNSLRFAPSIMKIHIKIPNCVRPKYSRESLASIFGNIYYHRTSFARIVKDGTLSVDGAWIDLNKTLLSSIKEVEKFWTSQVRNVMILTFSGRLSKKVLESKFNGSYKGLVEAATPNASNRVYSLTQNGHPAMRQVVIYK